MKLTNKSKTLHLGIEGVLVEIQVSVIQVQRVLQFLAQIGQVKVIACAFIKPADQSRSLRKLYHHHRVCW